MAGLYIHIPFCKKICHYCDFYKTLDTGRADRYIETLGKEMALQIDYLENNEVNTIYIGGGTPTVLSPVQIRDLLGKVFKYFKISDHAEITIEANPDDISRLYARDLRKSGINRVSLGIQSWNDTTLGFLNRRHTSDIALEAVNDIVAAGIENISADLIYGIPGMSLQQWDEDLQKTLGLGIKHLSAYHLTIEDNTVFGKMKKAGQLKEIKEEESEKQFNMLLEACSRHDFIQYEISNFCRDGYFSLHNTNYWRQEPYIGLGPSSHSYNGDSRQWNVSDLQAYMKSIENNELPSTVEILSLRDRYNEYVMTSLRTMWGIDLDTVEDKVNKESRDYLNNLSTRFVKYGMIKRDGNRLVLTDQGKMISDNIISELMMV